MYQRILVIQRRIESSQWGYLQRKPCHHSKSIATRNANRNTYKPPWGRNMFTQIQRCYILDNNELRRKRFYQELYKMQRLPAKEQQRTTDQSSYSQQTLEPSSNGYDDCFRQELLNYVRLLLRLLGIRHNPEQSNNCKCDQML